MKFVKSCLVDVLYTYPIGVSELNSGLDFLVDGSPPDMWEFRGWTQLPQNRNLRNPAVLTPHLMRHLYRDPKFLILVREPVER